MSTFFDGYQKATKPTRKKKGLIGLILIISIVVAATCITVLAIYSSAPQKTQDPKKQQSAKKAKKDDILKAWQDRNYEAVYGACNSSLELAPLDPFYLMFKGFSSFYLGIAEINGETRLKYMDETIFALRKALVDEKMPMPGQSQYILGKAYYYKGYDYYDDALAAFETAIQARFDTADIWEYMALISQELGAADSAIKYFEKALQLQAGSPELMLAAATAFLSAQRNKEAEDLAIRAMQKTTDGFIYEQAEFILVSVYINAAKYQEAIDVLAKIKSQNADSAEAYFQEGLIYSLSGDAIKARASWRKAVSMDPMHAGARQKLTERP